MSREAMKQALEALKMIDNAMPFPVAKHAIKQLSAALAEPEQEPVGFVNEKNLQGLTLGLYAFAEIYSDESEGRIPVYTHPPQRKPLTTGVIARCMIEVDDPLLFGRMGERCGEVLEQFARAIEAAHGIKQEETK